MVRDKLPDQASKLRSEMRGHLPKSTLARKKGPPIYAIASGKGGVGKTNVAVNLAWQLSSQGKRVLLFDADFGLGNTDILLGIASEKTLINVIQDGESIENIAISLNNHLTLIPTGSASFELANVNPRILDGVFLELERIADQYDVVLVDTGAGIGERICDTLLFSDHIIIVTSPDPTSLTDSYATVKMVTLRDSSKHFSVIVNMAKKKSDGVATFTQLAYVARKYLDLHLESWGVILEDERVRKAVIRQKNLFYNVIRTLEPVNR